MPYTAEISRTNPTGFLFLLDQSSSMLEPFGGQPEKSKAEGVADAINRLLQNLVLKCAKADGIRDFFHVGVIGYGGRVVSAFGGALAGKTLVPISEIANNPLRVELRTRKVDDGAGGLVEQKFKFPVWFEARPTGRTPMCEALRKAEEYLQAFLGAHPNCYPPLVINITDGQPTDGDPREAAKELRALASTDGNVLLFNAHLSDKQNRPDRVPRGRVGPAGRLRPAAVPHVERAAAEAAGGGAGRRLRGRPEVARLRLQRRPGGGHPLPGHRHPRGPERALTDAPRRPAAALARPAPAEARPHRRRVRGRLGGRPGRGPLRRRRRRLGKSFAGLWARLLAEGFVAARRPRDLAGWLGDARRRWAAEVMGLELPWYAEMKREQGAFATFLGLACGRPAADRPGTLASRGRRRQLPVPRARTAGRSARFR